MLRRKKGTFVKKLPATLENAQHEGAERRRRTVLRGRKRKGGF